VVSGLVSTIASSRTTATGDETDRDLAPGWIAALTVVCTAIAAWLAWEFVQGTPLAPYALRLTLLAVPFIVIVGFVIAGVAGYMAGLIGASNSPISGIGILGIVSCSSMLVVAVTPSAEIRPALVAFALFVTAIVFACATISNDNLQDLKTGQLVGASPMRQQIALIVGVIAGAAVIPFVLNLLAKAYGFAGAANVGVVAQNPLPAPQATLISALAQGVIGGNLDWEMIGIGALFGVGLILLDAVLGALKWVRIPALAVGIGIYLPMSATFAVVVGALIATWYDASARRSHDYPRAERLGTLVASGLIVGESLFGVLNAALIVAFSNDMPLALVPESFAPANMLGLAAFVVITAALYAWLAKKARSYRALTA
jgi:putative OPT family oligopeptide transporter